MPTPQYTNQITSCIDIWDEDSMTLYGNAVCNSYETITGYYLPPPQQTVETINTPAVAKSLLASPGYGPGILVARTAVGGSKSCFQYSTGSYNVFGSEAWTTKTYLSFITADGTEHELVDTQTYGKVHENTNNNCNSTPYSRGTTFISTDGAGMTFISDEPIYDYIALMSNQFFENYSSPSGYLLSGDGTRYRIRYGRIDWIRDRNGNLTTFGYDSTSPANGRLTSITDSLGRVTTIEYDVNDEAPSPDGVPYGVCDRITYRGFGNQPRTMRVVKKSLSETLRPNSGYALKTAVEMWPVERPTASAGMPVNPIDMVSVLWMPDGRRYRFYYNPFVELARVELPTGGAINYEYDYGINITMPNGTISHLNEFKFYRRLTQRRVYTDKDDASSLEGTIEYGQIYPPSSFNSTQQPPVFRTVTEEYKDKDGTRLSFLKHYYHGDPLTGSVKPIPGGGSTQLGVDLMAGREVQTDVLASDGTTVLRRVTYNWQPRVPEQGTGLQYTPARDVVLLETKTVIEPDGINLVTKQGSVNPQTGDIGYDQYNNQTDVWEYDYGVGEAGGVVRHKHTDFLTVNAVNGVDYANPAVTPTGVYLRGLPSRTSVYDANNVERERTTFEYDNYTPGPAGNNRHAALVPYEDIFGLCTTFDPAGNCSNPDPASYTTRGNVTATTNYLLDKDGNVIGSVTTNQRYDIAGNVVKGIDASVRPGGGGYETTFDFTDNFGAPDAEARDNTAPAELSSLSKKSYALARSVTNALGHTAYTQYDYHTGHMVNAEDANGTVTKQIYGQNDPLDRLTQTVVAANYPGRPDLYGQTTYSYDDANRTITTESDQQQFGDKKLKGVVVYDGLGRTVEARQYETATQYVATLTKYDALGRPAEVSNPYRPTLGEGPVWTKTAYDVLGRAWKVTTPDGAEVITHFDGLRTLVTDQDGQQRLIVSDALGRLIEVWEVRSSDPSSGTEVVTFPHHDDVPDVTAGYKTVYGYDVLGNLRKVEQGAQRRHFAYDSLGRLLRASNPEQEANGAPALPAGLLNWPSDAHNAWALACEYDEAGNLKKRTDARGVETTYAYDALGRLTDRVYTDVPLAQGGAVQTPPVKYYYDDQVLPEGAPAFARGKSLGRLVAVTYGGAASITGSYTGDYDEAGRARYSAQVTALSDAAGQPVPQPPYVFGYAYNLDGSLKRESYPTGRVVESEYDVAGRLAGVKKQGGDYYAGGAPSGGANSNVIGYTAHGAVAALRLGNGLWEHARYNSRFQIEEIGLGTSSADSSVLKLEYGYAPVIDGAPDPTRNNGNVRSQRISVPAAGQVPAQTFTQTYAYDALNRLESAAETNAAGPTWAQVYTYDRYGNRRLDESQTKHLNAQGQYVTLVDNANRAALNPAVSPATNRVSEAGYVYDAAGSLLCDQPHPCGTQPAQSPYFDYDGEGKMVEAGGKARDGGAEYVYDGSGQRVKKIVGAITTIFVYDATGGLVAEYGGEVAQTAGTSYLTVDVLGSTRVITGQDQQVKGRVDYLPFGAEVYTGRANYGGVNLSKKFTGYEHDSETNLDFAQARYYGNQVGRFTSVDPEMASAQLGQPQSWNRYVYCENNPLNCVDPTGLDGVWGYMYLGDGNYHFERFNSEAELAAANKILNTPFCQEHACRPYQKWTKGDFVFLAGDGRQVVRLEADGTMTNFSMEGYGTDDQWNEMRVAWASGKLADWQVKTLNYAYEHREPLAHRVMREISQALYDSHDPMIGALPGMSTELELAASAAGSIRASKYAATTVLFPEGETAFWSGSGQQARALASGFRTFETTPGGQAIINVTQDMTSRQAASYFRFGSRALARTNTGNAYAFLNQPRMFGTWRRSELPTLFVSPRTSSVIRF